MDAFIKTNIAFNKNQQNLILIHANNQFLCTAQYQVIFPFEKLQYQIKLTNTKPISLGLWNKKPLYLFIIKNTLILPNTSWQPLRSLMLQSDQATFRILGYASQLATHLTNNKFCGKCGSLMQKSNNGIHITCSNCNYLVYPRLNPSMIVLITNEDKLLLARSPRFETNQYSTLAGFIEAGESAEECVHREVLEEVGVKIHNLRYVTSQNWPYPQSLMLGYHADYLSGEIIPQPEEIEDAQWFSINNLPKLPPKQAISRYLIDLYIAERLNTPKPIFPN